MYGNQRETALMRNIMSNTMHNIVCNTSKTAHPLYISITLFTSAASSIIFSCSHFQIPRISTGTSRPVRFTASVISACAINASALFTPSP